MGTMWNKDNFYKQSTDDLDLEFSFLRLIA